jgi:predicted CopG family antitoxin
LIYNRETAYNSGFASAGVTCKASANCKHHLLFRQTKHAWSFEIVLYFGSAIGCGSGWTFSKCPAERKAVIRWASCSVISKCSKFHIFGVDKLLVMRTLNIAISDLEYEKLGIKTDQLSFTDFVDMISRELSRQNLKKAVELSERYGLSSMSMDEISTEVKAVRNNAAHR